MALGMLEAFELIEAVGAKALEFQDVLWAAGAKKRKGCRMVKSTLTQDDVARVIELGKKCRRWKEER